MFTFDIGTFICSKKMKNKKAVYKTFKQRLSKVLYMQ